MSKLPPLWFHQERGIHGFWSAVRRGVRRICITSPTGGGKTRTVKEIVEEYLREFKRVVWYTNRKMLLEQTSDVMDLSGLSFGRRAAGHFPEFHHPLQISSIQTEVSRSIKSEKWELHDADLVVIDECHLMCNPTAAKVIGRHLEKEGCVILGVTATPVDVGDFYDELVVAGTNSELRGCGALVTAYHYGPDEPDLKQIGGFRPSDDVSEEKNRKIMGRVENGNPDVKITALFGRVFDWWQKLSPRHQWTLGFGPGVAESLWFAMQFHEKGVKSAHIDGEEVWVDGELHRSKRGVRDQVVSDFKSGHVKTLWNRFVMREGVDIPEVEHIILACVISGLATEIQLGGRGLRACPRTGKDRCVYQDHGGNWWRHGSYNQDRHWDLTFKSSTYSAKREDAFRDGEVKEPVLCPECRKVLNSLRCSCGFVVNPTAKTRPVIQADGSLVEQAGDILPKRIRKEKPDTQKLWTQMYYRAWNMEKEITFRALEGLFCTENYYWPVRTLALMPKSEDGIYRKVRDVPLEELRGPLPPSLAGWVRKRLERLKATTQKSG